LGVGIYVGWEVRATMGSLSNPVLLFSKRIFKKIPECSGTRMGGQSYLGELPW
jgi:hypothetical protein